MCQTYIDGFGYICYECKDEFSKFIDSLPKEKRPTQERQFIKLLLEFKETDKYSFDDSEEITLEEFFKKYTCDW